MSERLSTGFANAINAVGSVKSVMANGIIHLYSGTQPADADLAETGNLLMILTQDSLAFTPGNAANGLNMDLSVDGVLAKSAAETWSGIGEAIASTGTVAGWFRWYDNAREMGASVTAIRMDGAIGTSAGFEMQMSNSTIVADVAAVVQSFNYTTARA